MSYTPNNPNGQAVMAGSAPVVVASNQTAIPVSGTFWQTTQPISVASLPLPTGAALDATLTGGTARSKVTDGTNNAAVKAASTAAVATDPALVVAVSPNNTVPVSLAALPALATGSNVIGSLVANQSVNVAQINGVAPLMGNGVTGTGSQRVTIASDNTANTNPWLIRHAAATTSSGLLFAKILSAATTNATLVLTGTRALYGWHLANTSASWRYVRIYAKATAPTVGTDSPLFVIPLPPGGGAVLTPGMVNIPVTLGLGYSITGAAADLDATAVAANDVVGTLWYI